MIELAVIAPTTVAEMDVCRNVAKGFGKSAFGEEIIQVIQKAKKDSPDCYPQNWKPLKPLTATQHTLVELFRLLLSIQSVTLGVAPRIIASNEELQQLARGNNDVMCMRGWRRDVFGEKVLLFKQGKLSFCFNPQTRKPELRNT